MSDVPGAVALHPATHAPAGPNDGIGVLVPFDFALDRELRRWVPEPVALHLARVPCVPSPVTTGMARAISDGERVRRAARDLPEPAPGTVAYACTSGSFVDGPAGEAALRRVMLDAGAPHATTTAGSLVDALHTVGAGTVAIVTPYAGALTDRLTTFLAAHGITVTGAVALGVLGQIWRVSQEEVARAVRAADHPGADAVFLSCTTLATYDLIAPLERELGKPVLTANQVTVWGALRAIGGTAHGPGQRLIHAADAGTPGTAVPLHRVRVRLSDEAGSLARLTEAVASAGGNILGLAVHGQDSRSVVDELIVSGAADRALLDDTVRAVAGRSPEDVLVTEGDPHDLVDAPTRALDLAAQAVTTGDPASALAALLHADRVTVQEAEPDAGDHVLAVPAPRGGWLVAEREWAPFTVTEAARAAAFVRVLSVLTAGVAS